MTRQHLPIYALAVAIAFVGALWAGVSIGTLLFVAAVLACPLMMIFMMRDMHGGGAQQGSSRPEASHREAADRDPHTPTGV
ncbi:MAG TPA: DUF2933 domain-containing protein [Micromonosporaceae bacterium]